MQVAAIYATDRNQLKLFLENKFTLSVPAEEELAFISHQKKYSPPLSFGYQKTQKIDFISSYLGTIGAKKRKSSY